MFYLRTITISETINFLLVGLGWKIPFNYIVMLLLWVTAIHREQLIARYSGMTTEVKTLIFENR